jgi:hypothetical protein
MSDTPTYHDALAALTGLVGKAVTVAASQDGEEGPPSPFMITGHLDAGWDQDVLEANGAPDVAIFRIKGTSFATFIEPETFRDARISEGRVDIRLGDI